MTMPGRNFLESFMTSSSISCWTIDSTERCFTTSRKTPSSPPPDDQHLLRAGVAAERQVGNHLLVGELIPVSTLDDTIQNHQHIAVGFTTEDKDALVPRPTAAQQLLHPQQQVLARPQAAGLWNQPLRMVVGPDAAAPSEPSSMAGRPGTAGHMEAQHNGTSSAHCPHHNLRVKFC